jgi:predicted phosphohydrolase
MKRFLWLTDIHLNFLTPAGVADFLDRLVREVPDGLFVGGDIGEAPPLAAYLRCFLECLPCPIYFVLGNHDYYRGSIAGVRKVVGELCRQYPLLVYLSASEAVELTPRLALVGHDGWGDGRTGDYERSDVMLNDYFLIEELALHDKQSRLPLLQRLGDEAADHMRRVLPPALARYDEVIVLTHVPPFREACWYAGRISDDEWSPHFTCMAMGKALLEIMEAHPHRKITVLCGHTHSGGETRIRDNLVVLTGGAEYGRPTVQRVFDT